MKENERLMHVTLSMDIGGLETVIKELCLRLAPDRFSSEVLCLRGYDEDNIAQLSEGGIPVHVQRKNHKFDLPYFLRVANFLRQRKIDVLHAHSGCFFYAALFARLAGIRRFVYTAHGLPVLNRLQDRIEDNLAGLACSAIVPVSQEIQEVLQKRMPRAKNKMQLILNGIDTDRFRPLVDMQERQGFLSKYGLPEGAFLVGSVGRLDPVKNYPMLLRAFAQMSDASDRSCSLVLIGDGPCRSELEILGNELGISERMIFLGRQYRVWEILPLLDVFVLSSFTEGTSVALLEAQACGVPAVVTHVGGNGSIVSQRENGFLCRVNDDEAMAAVLGRLRTDQELAGQMRNAARKRVLDGFGLHAMVQRYEALYRDCASLS
jgi:glycosyltransferase involved in cell wall biosynthesis